MRAFAAALAVVLSACVPSGDPSPAPSSAIRAAPPSNRPVATDLPAVDPVVPTLAAFRVQARKACGLAVAQIAAAPVLRDPFLDDAPLGDIQAAEAHYRVVADAWTAMAGALWEFGLPDHPKAEGLITQLDTVAQYAIQAADLLAEGEVDTAQVSIGWTAQEMRRAERIAAALGVGPLGECGIRSKRLSGAVRVPVHATDFAFTVAPLKAGPTRFVIRNQGKEAHHLYVVRLRNAGTLAEALAADRESGSPGRFLADAGVVSSTVSPGGRTTLDVDLRRGPTGLLCYLPSPDATPHAYKGMAVEVVVQ